MGRVPSCSTELWRKGPWSPEEDALLIKYIEANRIENYCWRSLPKLAGLMRSGKSCRLRWINYLRPDIKRGSISSEEEDLILRLHRLIGNRWSLIAGRLPGRTDNEIKNYWKCHLRKKVENGCSINIKAKKSRKKEWDNVILNKHPVVSSAVQPPNSSKELPRRDWEPSSGRLEMCAKNYYSSKGQLKTHHSRIPKILMTDNSCLSLICPHVDQLDQEYPGQEVQNHLANLVFPRDLTCETDSTSQPESPLFILPSCVMDGAIDMEHCFQLLEAATITSDLSSPKELTMDTYASSETSSWGRSTAGTSGFNMETSIQTSEKTSYCPIPSSSVCKTYSLIEKNQEQPHSLATDPALVHAQASETLATPYGTDYCNALVDFGSAEQRDNPDQALVTQCCTTGLDLADSSPDMQKAFETLYTFEDWQTCEGYSSPCTAMNSDQTPTCMDAQDDFLYKNICPDQVFAYCF